MCGRFSLAYDKETVVEYLIRTFAVDDIDYDLPRYNIAPGQDVPTLIFDGSQYRAGPIKWGFKPFFAAKENSSFQLVNIRSESLGNKPMFDQPLRKGRCLVLADGFYEWNEKKPYRIMLEDQRFFLMPGLWTSYRDDDGASIHTAAIITKPSDGSMRDIHDRMPVMLNHEAGKKWLTVPAYGKTDRLWQLHTRKELHRNRVSDIVNSPENDNEACIKPR